MRVVPRIMIIRSTFSNKRSSTLVVTSSSSRIVVIFIMDFIISFDFLNVLIMVLYQNQYVLQTNITTFNKNSDPRLISSPFVAIQYKS